MKKKKLIYPNKKKLASIQTHSFYTFECPQKQEFAKTFSFTELRIYTTFISANKKAHMYTVQYYTNNLNK